MSKYDVYLLIAAVAAVDYVACLTALILRSR
jgi:hypothetical protein